MKLRMGITGEQVPDPPRDLQLNTLSTSAAVAKVVGMNALQAGSRCYFRFQPPTLKATTNEPPEHIVPAADGDRFFPVPAPVDHDGDFNALHDIKRNGFIEPGAGYVKRPVAVIFNPPEGVKGMFCSGDGVSDDIGARFYKAAVGGQDSNFRSTGPSQDFVISPFPFPVPQF